MTATEAFKFTFEDDYDSDYVDDFRPLQDKKVELVELLQNRGSVAAMELLAQNAGFILEKSLAELESSGHITRFFERVGITGDSLVCYELAKPYGVAEVAVSAGSTIKEQLDVLNDRAFNPVNGNIQSLTSEEWCLRTILEKAHDNLLSGAQEIDMAELQLYTIDHLRDEGVDKWLTAFDTAAEHAAAIFERHPDDY